MLPTSPDPMRLALNRLTFGARDLDVTLANTQGLDAWLADQFAVPGGDDADLAAHIAVQTMRIRYDAPDATTPNGKWQAVDEFRPLNYLDADIPTLWAVSTQAGTNFSFQERNRIRQELLAATWIRNAHSKYQLREFMTDFWLNHFNIGKNENQQATDLLISYDRGNIRPNVFGNFKDLLRATAQSSSMLIYLDNATSTAVTPNENYAREIMELHTLGGGAYLGVDLSAGGYAVGMDGVRTGFTDQDVIQGSRALSGWTIARGQRISTTTVAPNNGTFLYNPAQHNTHATSILNVDISGLTGNMEQGLKFIDIIANHRATASFVVTKLCVRIFGDTPPQAVIDRGVEAWKAYATAPNQIQRVLEAIILGGSEIWTLPPTKVRRPYERLMALARTTDMVVNANVIMTGVLDPLNDAVFAWQAPNGRPDVNSYWLATGAMLTTWNLLIQFPSWASNTTSLGDQTPVATMSSATQVVEYWVGRMIGYAPATATMSALVADQTAGQGVPAAARTGSSSRIETACRRLVSLIAATEEFAYR